METLQQPKLLRFVICGSVDDGKSTLMGRMLHDAGLIYGDHLEELARDSKKYSGTAELDFSLLMDGLKAEREQKITIDVAYRYFSTTNRSFIAADAPGHSQYTQNMATAASTAEAALVLVSAENGLQPQTRRHSLIASLFGIRHLVLIVNKMDTIDYSQSHFESLCEEYRAFMQSQNCHSLQCIPVSALLGENIVQRSKRMPWYHGPTLLECLDSLAPVHPDIHRPFRMAVQWVNRPDTGFRGYCGRLSSGTLSPGTPITVMPSGQQTKIGRIVSFDGDKPLAVAGQSVTLTLTDEIDISRGDVLCAHDSACETADELTADLIWFSDVPVSGRPYRMKTGSTYALCSLLELKTSEEQTGRCHIRLDRMIACETYDKNRSLGCFILSDRFSHEIIAAGLIRQCRQRIRQIPLQSITVDPSARALLKLQSPQVIWFTGLSGAGKSGIANLLEKKLYGLGYHTMMLDANNLRHGLNKDLDFNSESRIENIRRIAETAKLMMEAGLIVLVACIAPFAEGRDAAKKLIGADGYAEIFVDAPVDIIEKRDPRGLYAMARSGEIAHFTGITDVYEPPISPDLQVDSAGMNLEQCTEYVLEWLLNSGKLRKS